MAEVLGPLGLCLAGMSFILSTVPSAAKAAHTYQELQSQKLAMELRFAVFLRTFMSWEEEWRNSKLNTDNDLVSRVILDTQRLSQNIKIKIAMYSTNEDDKKDLKDAERRFRHGKFRSRPRKVVQEIRHSIAYILWQKNFLDEWLNQLETVIKSIDALYRIDRHHRTAEMFNKELAQSIELRQLDDFASKLYKLATDVYNDCTSIPETHAWGVGLQTPRPGCDISRWKIPIPIRMELQFSVEQCFERNEHFRLQVVYKEEDDSTRTSKGALDQINDIVAPTTGGACGRHSSVTKVYKKVASTRKTPSIADLFQSSPHLFQDDTWLLDRRELIFGISQWSLLLWNTPWLDGFCCDGLTVEVDSCSEEGLRYIFEARKPDECRLQGLDHKLRNLGLVWAQLVLGQRIDSGSENDMQEFDLWSKEKREKVRRSDINERVHMETGSDPLQEAINLCLEPQPRLSGTDFEPGHLYMYIEKMHNRIKTWYESECATRKRIGVKGSQTGWPHEAMFPLSDIGRPESLIPRADSPNSGFMQSYLEPPILDTPIEASKAPLKRRAGRSPIGDPWV